MENNLFTGNYWDFDNSPNGLKEFFESLGYNVIIEDRRYKI